MAKIQLKSDNINPFGGLFSILKQFDRSGLRRTIDSTLGKRAAKKQIPVLCEGLVIIMCMRINQPHLSVLTLHAGLPPADLLFS